MKGHWCCLDVRLRWPGITPCMYITLVHTVNLVHFPEKGAITQKRTSTHHSFPKIYTCYFKKSFFSSPGIWDINRWHQQLEEPELNSKCTPFLLQDTYVSFLARLQMCRAHMAVVGILSITWPACSVGSNASRWCRYWVRKRRQKHQLELTLNNRGQFNVKGLGTSTLGSGLWTSLSISGLKHNLSRGNFSVPSEHNSKHNAKRWPGNKHRGDKSHKEIVKMSLPR